MIEYRDRLLKSTDISFEQIISTAKELLPLSYKEQPWTYEKSRGKALLKDDISMNCYLAAYGSWHQGKLEMIFDKLPVELLNDSFNVVDWGCGQGLATAVLADYLRRKRKPFQIDQIKLIEPSKKAIDRALLHVKCILGNRTSTIDTIEKFLDEVTEEDLQFCNRRPILHLFSNILDVEGIDMKTIVANLRQLIDKDNYIAVASPTYFGGTQRVNSFLNYFNAPNLFINKYNTNKQELGYTYNLKGFKIGAKEELLYRKIKFYPPVEFFAAYQLNSMSELDQKMFGHFELFAPFDIGLHYSEDIHPILAVVSNIITRGIPTIASPYIERTFQNAFNISKDEEKYGSFSFPNKLSDTTLQELSNFYNQLKTCRNPKGECKNWDTKKKAYVQLILSPIAIARVQKTILEALMIGRLDINSKNWKILIEENDVPCAVLAIEELKTIFHHISALSRQYKHYKLPNIELNILHRGIFSNSQLHGGALVKTPKDVSCLCSDIYDLVINVSTIIDNNDLLFGFEPFKAKNQCYFALRSTPEQKNVRMVYTTDLVQYEDVVVKDERGEYRAVEENVEHLRYFLQLIFRKKDFREGQLPILNRALNYKSVIGLLPTGGGKSLTYQLAAMLQPGVTLVVDPLKSLMKDQYDGLINTGIDCCTFINGSISSEERREREQMMESSQLLFVFLSPERLAIYGFRERLRNMSEQNIYFSYGVIDEVHCVSEWGQDFRFSYLHLGRNLYNYVKPKSGHISLFGLTATASFDVLADVERELSGDNAFVLDAETIVRFENTNRLELQYKIERIPIGLKVDESFNRNGRLPSDLPKAKDIKAISRVGKEKTNYLISLVERLPDYFAEIQKTGNLRRIKECFKDRINAKDLPSADIRTELERDFYRKKSSYSSAGIVFCPHRKNTNLSVDVNYTSLEQLNTDLGRFTGGSDADADQQSMKNLEEFRDNQQSIMVATKAFGMGIDKPNVRFTVNMNYSSSLESFVQEAGRAGRDQKMALSLVLYSDYELVKFTTPLFATYSQFPWVYKNKWFTVEEAATILRHNNIEYRAEYVDFLTPTNDFVKVVCKVDNAMFAFKKCISDCKHNSICTLHKIEENGRGWVHEYELRNYLRENNIKVARENLEYANPDYQTVFFFHEQNFKGMQHEKKVMYELLSRWSANTFVGNEFEYDSKKAVRTNNLLARIYAANVNEDIVAFIDYNIDNKDDVAKAIFRMCSIGLIVDFTQDYGKNQYRVVAVKRAVGEYFEALKRFLMRYYPENKAKEEVEKAASYRGENEIHRCLGYLTEFVYEKIATKRKQAIDDMRQFCSIGLDSTKDWVSVNEDLKDYLYYYFNSKYAREDYRTELGESYSLTTDRMLLERGNSGSMDYLQLVLKYLQVVDPKVYGVGTPIDSIKHLQGAVRLIRRGIMDDSPILPSLNLINVYCSLFLGTNNNQNIIREIKDNYITAYERLREQHKGQPSKFYKFIDRYMKSLPEDKSKALSKKKMRDLQLQAEFTIHINWLDKFNY